MNNSSSPNRIAFIDGMRGLAISMVVIFHAYARGPKLVPYGDTFTNLLTANGRLGVQLFFMISGYVILMTLRNCQSYGEFVWRRWSRLFPAMLICSLFIYLTAGFFSERPKGPVSIPDLIPGLTFLAPDWWSWALKTRIRGIEGSFWTLYVEAKFYIVFGALFFLFKEKKALTIMVMLCLLAAASLAVKFRPLSMLEGNLASSEFCWFLIGSLVYVWQGNRNPKILYLIIAICLCSPVLTAYKKNWNTSSMIAAHFVAAFFVVSFMSVRLRQFLVWKPLLLTGFVSYPLYMLHENIMIASIIKLGRTAPFIPKIALPFIPIAFVFGLSWIIARYCEPVMRRGLAKLAGRNTNQTQIGNSLKTA